MKANSRWLWQIAMLLAPRVSGCGYNALQSQDEQIKPSFTAGDEKAVAQPPQTEFGG